MLPVVHGTSPDKKKNKSPWNKSTKLASLLSKSKDRLKTNDAAKVKGHGGGGEERELDEDEEERAQRKLPLAGFRVRRFTL